MSKRLFVLSIVCALLPLSAPLYSQNNAGVILFGNARDVAMDYCLDSGSAGQFDRYYLEIKTQKFKYAEVIVTYPEHFSASFDPTQIELYATGGGDCRSGKPIPLESAKWDKEARRITVVPKEAIPANTPVRLVLSNVRNPNFAGLYQIDAWVLRADVPAPVYIGSWILGID